MKKIGVFGGTFDPPHLGHLFVLINVINAKLVDEIWVVPSARARSDKEANMDFNSRKEMISILTKKVKFPIIVKDTQAREGLEESFTIDLLNFYSQKYIYDFKFIIGSDNLDTLESWKSYTELEKNYGFIVVPRKGEVSSFTPENSIILDRENCFTTDLSSQKIRDFFSKGYQLDGFLSENLLEYLEKNSVF